MSPIPKTSPKPDILRSCVSRIDPSQRSPLWIFPMLLLQIVVVEVLGALVYTQITERWSFHERFLVGLLMTVPVNFVIFGFSMLYWVPYLKNFDPKPDLWLQEATLDGHTLRVTLPRELTVSLDESYTAVVGRRDRRWSVTFFSDREKPLTLVVKVLHRYDVQPWTDFVWPPGWKEMADGPRRSRPVHWANDHVFGDALLSALEETAERNQVVVWAKRLSARGLRPASEPFACVLAVDSAQAGVPFRTGRPSPDQPGFAAWAEREGFSPATGVTLTVEHLVVDDEAGLRVAFPLGATVVRDEKGTLCLSSTDRAGKPIEARVHIADPILRAALGSCVVAVSGGHTDQ